MGRGRGRGEQRFEGVEHLHTLRAEHVCGCFQRVGGRSSAPGGSGSVSSVNDQQPTDWVTRAADEAIRHAGEGKLVTCASGISPSGPIHVGNLR